MALEITDEFETLKQAVNRALRTRTLQLDTALDLIASALELAQRQPFRRESIASLMMAIVERVQSRDERFDEMWNLFSDLDLPDAHVVGFDGDPAIVERKWRRIGVLLDELR
jgi:hypothetical protein